MTNDIRWIQRLDNYEKLVKRLESAVALLKRNVLYDDMGNLLKEGLIQRYEYTQELVWKLMKDDEDYTAIVDVCQ